MRAKFLRAGLKFAQSLTTAAALLCFGWISEGASKGRLLSGFWETFSAIEFALIVLRKVGADFGGGEEVLVAYIVHGEAAATLVGGCVDEWR